MGQVESKSETSDRGETPTKKSKKTSHKSPSKKKTGKPTDFQSELKSMDDKWSERFARLEAMFLARSFTVPIEPVQKGDVVVTDRPFIPPVQQTTGVTGQKQPTGQVQPAGQREMKKATQPVEAPSAGLATQPVEAPGADPEMLHIGQDTSLPFAADRSKVQPPGPASQIFISGRSEVQPPDPTGQPATILKKRATSFTGTTTPVDKLVSEGGYISDQASSNADEGEVSDLESAGLDPEELLYVEQELSAEQNYRETLRGVRSFMTWNDIPEFDSASSSQDIHLPVQDLHTLVKCLSRFLWIIGYTGSLRN